MSIFQAVLLQIDERHEVDWDAVKQVDIVTIGDDGDVDIVVTMKFQQKFKVFDRIFSIPKFGKVLAKSQFFTKFLFKFCHNFFLPMSHFISNFAVVME